MADGAPESLLCAHRMVGVSHFALGDVAKARQHCEKASAFIDTSNRGELIAQLGVDPAVMVLCYQAIVLAILGFAEQSDQSMLRVRALRFAEPQASARAVELLLDALRAICLRDHVAAVVDAEELSGLAIRHRLPMCSGHADIARASTIIESGEPAALAYGRGLAELASVKTRINVPLYMAGLASSLAACGRHEEALSTIERALAECAETAQGWCEAELWRVRGVLVLGEPMLDETEAVRCFDQALTIARARGARLWELRAAVSMACLWAEQGERGKALELLVPIYNWFTEGFGTVDLVEARALLSVLRQPTGVEGH
jgi:predicted ATPase